MIAYALISFYALRKDEAGSSHPWLNFLFFPTVLCTNRSQQFCIEDQKTTKAHVSVTILGFDCIQVNAVSTHDPTLSGVTDEEARAIHVSKTYQCNVNIHNLIRI